MDDDSSIDGKRRDPNADEQERIRQLNVAELEALCDRVGVEAQARGLTEEILNEILNEELTAEEASECRTRVQELRACVAENRELGRQRGSTETDVTRPISETREGRPKR